MITVAVSADKQTAFDLAKVTLHNTDSGTECELDLDFKTLYQGCGVPNNTVLDFLFMSSVFYATDKFINRDIFKDRWTRVINVRIPVYELEKWHSINQELNRCMSFLTGDSWDIEFYRNDSNLHRPARTRTQATRPSVQGDAVCLFSGGLDSLVGAIDWLEMNTEKRILLVSHYDGHVKGPRSDQIKLLNHLQIPKFSSRVDSLQIRVGQRPAGFERTFRSRSILFLALGIYAAARIGEDTPVMIPENGTIALNIPLTPSRRGSCSTRTAHPNFINMVNDILQRIGIHNTIVNPLGHKTKGEVVRECRSQEVLRNAIFDSVSCGKSGHKSSWIRRDAKGCGRCVPCIFRRAALHTINTDTENYGVDICSGEIDLTADRISTKDIKAVLAFLGHNYNLEEIKALLIASGLKFNEIDGYAELVLRAVGEVRKLIKDKGTPDIIRMAGII